MVMVSVYENSWYFMSFERVNIFLWKFFVFLSYSAPTLVFQGMIFAIL